MHGKVSVHLFREEGSKSPGSVLTIADNKEIFEFTAYVLYDSFIQDGKMSIYLPHNHVSVLISQTLSEDLYKLRATLQGNTVVQERAPENKENIIVKKRNVATDLKSKELTTPKKIGHKSLTVLKSPSYSPLLKTMKCNTPLLKKTLCKEREAQDRKSILLSPKLSIKLSTQQKDVIEVCLSGENVFYTGGAGTGKSHLLQHIIEALSTKRRPHSVFVTATTGLAACSVGGVTVHQFAGLRVGSGNCQEEMVQEAVSNTAVIRRWRQASVLIIDEISMLSASMLEVAVVSSYYST